MKKDISVGLKEVGIYLLVEGANKLLSKEEKEDFVKDMEALGVELRICSECGNIMYRGYIIDGGDEYYCNDDSKEDPDECLHKHYTDDEFAKLCKENNDENCYTEWN